MEAFFTDASKDSSGSGCAFVHKETSKQYACNKWSSIGNIELEAIHTALKYATEQKMKNVVVYTDSQSALLTLDNLFTQNDVVGKIRSCIHRGSLKVHFCWVPSHIGIPGNEKADQLARTAITLGEQLNTATTAKDFDRTIKQALLRQWQTRWTQSTNNKLKFVKPKITDWKTCYRRSRHEEITLTRLRIGHTRLTHLYLITRQDKPACTLCGQELTVHHILCECPRLDSTRHQFQIPYSIAEILQDDEDCIKRLFKYLQETDLMKEI